MKIYCSFLASMLSLGLISYFSYSNKPNQKIDNNKLEQGRLPLITTISAESLKAMIENTANYDDPEQCDFIVVNVLSARLYNDCHIKGSINAPLDELYIITQQWEKKGWHQNKTIIVYCALDECDASEKAYYLLRGLEFANIIAYEGGIREWFQLGYPTEGPCSFDYLRSYFNPTCDECPCLGLCKMTFDTK